VGIVFQAFNLLSSLDATENVMVPMRAADVPRKEARARALGLLDEVGLRDRAHHKPGDLSGGQQQRVAIARALALDPPLVLADEPTAHLDYVQVEGVLRIIRRLARPGRVVIVSTHDERMLPLADQVVEMAPKEVPVPAGPKQVQLAAGELLFAQGDPADMVYVVDAGAVELFREAPDGGEVAVRVMRAGEYFGEMGPLFHLPRSASARALEPTALTALSVQEFRARSKGHGFGAAPPA
jgi:putative ABC transport system ATP-binding protein